MPSGWAGMSHSNAWDGHRASSAARAARRKRGGRWGRSAALTLECGAGGRNPAADLSLPSSRDLGRTLGREPRPAGGRRPVAQQQGRGLLELRTAQPALEPPVRSAITSGDRAPPVLTASEISHPQRLWFAGHGASPPTPGTTTPIAGPNPGELSPKRWWKGPQVGAPGHGPRAHRGLETNLLKTESL